MNRHYITAFFLFSIVLVSLSFFVKTFTQGLIPFPADTITGLYHPYRDYYADEYPNGMPYDNFLVTDPVRQQFVWRNMGIDQMREGHMPLWNPYQNAGAPLLANLQSAVFYPLNSIFLVVPFTTGWSILVMLQPVIAGVGMYLYLRKLGLRHEASFMGSIVYGFSGFSIAWLTWNTIGHTTAWLPYVLLVKEHVLRDFLTRSFTRKTWYMLGLLIAAESSYWLAGHVQTALYVWIITNVYLCVRAWQLRTTIPVRERTNYIYRLVHFFGLAVVLVFLIVSVQAYSFIQYVLLSSRSVDQAAWMSTEGWFVPWKHLAQFVAPDFFGNPATLNYRGTWNYGELVGYAGVIPLLLAGIAMVLRRDKKTLFYSIVGLGALICALPTPVAKLPFLLHIPFWSTMQPTRLLFVVNFSLSVLSALGLDYLLRRKVSGKKIIVPFAIVGLVYGWLWFVALAGNFDVSQRNLLLPTALYISGVTTISLIRPVRQIRLHVLLITLLLFVVCFDLFRFGWKFTPFTDAAYVYPETKTIEFLKKQDGVFRIMSTDNRLLPPNIAGYHRIEDIAGYDPLYTARYGQFVSAWVRGKPDISPFSFNRIITPQQYDSRFTDFLNVRYILSLGPLESDTLIPVFQEGQTYVYENTRAFPRAFLVPDVVVVTNDQHEIDVLFDEDVDLAKTATTQESLSVSPVPLSDRENVRIESHTEFGLTVSVTAAYPRLMVVSNVYYPYWHAEVDGTSVPVYRVNYSFTGVVVPEGTHTVKLFTAL